MPNVGGAVVPHRAPKPKRPLSLEDEEQMRAILTILNLVVEQAGENFIYAVDDGDDLCRYVKDGKPDCIIGHTLHWYGISLESLSAWEGSACENMATYNPWSASIPLIPVAPVVLETLQVAQAKQDSGQTWGDARDAALFYAYTEHGVKLHA